MASTKAPMKREYRTAIEHRCDRMGGAAYAMHAQAGHQDGSDCGGGSVLA